MPIAIILTIMPAALLGTVMVLMVPGDDRVTAMAMGVGVVLIGILFIAIMVTMRTQHPSQDGGDSHLPQDRSPTDADAEADDFDDAETPTTWLSSAEKKDDEDRPDLGRWSDDGAPPLGRG